jgi:hypothetical protein
MLQFSITVDEKTQQLSWIGNISPAQAASFIAQYMEQTIANLTSELQKGKADATGKPTE